MRPITPTASELPGDLGAVYGAEGPRLWRAVFAYSGDRDVASDAVAEAFAQCLRRGDAVRDPRAWVWRAAFKIAAGELQRRRTITDRIPEGTYEMPDDPRRLLDALAKLSPVQRGVLVMRHYAGEPTDLIAAALGMSRATVRVHLSRGRKRLASLLEDHEDD